MKMPIRKNIHNMPLGPPNPGFMQEKVHKGDFPKKDSWELKKRCFRFIWIYQRSETKNYKRVFFWLSKNLYKQCVLLFQTVKALGLSTSDVKNYPVSSESPQSGSSKRPTLHFFFEFVSWPNNAKTYQPTELPRRYKMKPLKSFWSKTTLKLLDFWAGKALDARTEFLQNFFPSLIKEILVLIEWI